MTSNNAIVYKGPPDNKGFIQKGTNVEYVKRKFDLEGEDLNENDFIIENLYCSIDPYLRGRMRPKTMKSYAPAFEVGEPLNNGGVGRVVRSKNPKFPVGVYVSGVVDWAEYTVVPAEMLAHVIYHVIDNKYNLPFQNYCGVLGMPGITAYGSFYQIGKPQKGETIYISAASGAVGQIVGQLAKIEGLTVVGSAGSDEKVAYLKNELHFDAAFNYKTEKPSEALPKYCPKGIDIYYENVGGETLEAVLDNLNLHSRIIASGMISQYNTPDPYGIKNLMNIVAKRVTLQGFMVFDFYEKIYDEVMDKMGKMLAEKKIVYKEHVAEGLEKGEDAFIGLYQGDNFGKAMIAVKGK